MTPEDLLDQLEAATQWGLKTEHRAVCLDLIKRAFDEAVAAPFAAKLEDDAPEEEEEYCWETGCGNRMSTDYAPLCEEHHNEVMAEVGAVSMNMPLKQGG